MRFLIDENVARQLTQPLESRGHDIHFVGKGASDRDIFNRSKQESEVLISMDTDFLDIVKFPLADTPGRIVLRIFPTIFSLQQERVADFADDQLPNMDLKEKLIIVTEDRVIVREE